MNQFNGQYGLWSWGHVIYDYKRFFNNMKKLGMNSVIVWNDIVPINASKVLEYAHSLGIKLIWGFSWGWVDGCGTRVKCIDNEATEKISDSVVEEFVKDYKAISPDGIYFQSFTELGNDEIDGVCIAESVTDFVNRTAARIFEITPEIEILFGLHATSVNNHLDFIKRTDPRIRIVWEDCGAFPYAYDPLCVDGYRETEDFVAKALKLRGENEKCGFIIKGMTTLDWSCFEYHKEPYAIGGKDEAFIANRLNELKPKWEKVSDGWRKNYSFCRESLRQIISQKPDAYIYGLIEDGMFEAEIPGPAKALSAMIKNPEITDEDICALLK